MDVRVSRRTLSRLSWLLVVLALVVGVGGVVAAQDRKVTAKPGPPTLTEVTAAPTPTVTIAPLKRRISPHLLVVSKEPFTYAQVGALVRATGAKAAIQVGAGTLTIATGRTTALSVDPDEFRAWSPKGTAESDPVWRSVAAGDAAVAHVVARAFEVPLGGPVTAQVAFPVQLQVGSFTTTALPGIGLIVNSDRGAELGIVPHTGLLLSVPQRDANASARLAGKALANGMSVTAVHYDAAPVRTGGWGIPTVGRVSSAFGLRLHPIKKVVLFHDGIDISAPYGAPVYAMSDGFVLYAGPARGFGTEVVLSHRNGVTTVYGHVSRVLVTSGPVKAGQPIALIGNEGDSTGPHLHAEVRVNDKAVDPILWLRTHGVRI